MGALSCSQVRKIFFYHHKALQKHKIVPFCVRTWEVPAPSEIEEGYPLHKGVGSDSGMGFS